MIKLELLLHNLNSRKKFLLVCFVFLCALFLAFKFHDNFLQDFFKKTRNFPINEIKLELAYLQEIKNNLIEKMAIEDKKLQDYIQKLNSYSYDKNSFIKQINNLCNHLSINNLKISQKNKFPYHYIFIDLQANFEQILPFIHNLEYLNMHSQIHSIELDNSRNLNLHLKLNISFIDKNKIYFPF